MDRQATAFRGATRIAQGPLGEVALAVARDGADGVLTFDDATGRIVDLDLTGGDTAIAARYAPPPPTSPTAPRRPGRPKLGVTAREVTLLPRHWDWLAGQPGGASATLRRLVEAARRDGAGPDRARRAQEAAYRAMQALAGDLPGYEEALRALFAGNRPALAARMAGWPADIRTYALRLAQGSDDDR